MKKFYWSGFCNEERYAAIKNVVAIINKYGTILNFQRYSDITLSFVIELEENKLGKLYDNLNNSILITEKLNETDYSSIQECQVLLNLTFINNTGDLEIANPGLVE